MIAVPAIPATTIEVISGPISRIGREHEEAAEPVDRAEQREEVRGLQARRAVADGDGREQQREPAQPQREQELCDEFVAVRVRRAHRGDGRPAGEDHHVSEFLEHAAQRPEGAFEGWRGPAWARAARSLGAAIDLHPGSA